MEQPDSVDACTQGALARYPQIDPVVEGVIDRMSAIGRHVSRIFEQTVAHHGLNHGEYKVLQQLAIAERPLSAGELSRALLLSTGAMTNRLDRLETAGHLRRVADPKDRRGVLVELTDGGRELIDHAVAEQAAKEIDVLSALPAGELDRLNRLLRKVLVSLEHRPAEARERRKPA